MKKIALIVTALAALVLGAGIATPAAAYPPGETARLVVAPPVGGPGYTFTATVLNCFPGETVEFNFNNGDIKFDTCDLTTFQATVTYLAPAALGPYPVVATLLGFPQTDPEPEERLGFRSAQAARVAGPGDGPVIGERPLVLNGEIEVVDQTPTTTAAPGVTTTTAAPAGQIPTTGSSGVSTGLAIGGIAFVVGLGLLVVAGVRRRDAANQS